MKVSFNLLRLVGLLLIFFPANPALVSGGTAKSTPVTGRDWHEHPAIVELAAPEKFYALGDVHGDCDRMLQLLAAEKLIAGIPPVPKAVIWTGGKTILVLTGDMIDKFGQSLPVIVALRTLEQQARIAGGRLVVCLGNHEAEFLAFGGEGKKSAEFEEELKAAGIAPSDVAAGRDSAGIGLWMRNLPAGAKIGDWFFCHAGNTNGKSLAALRTQLEKELIDQGYSTALLIDPNSMLEARMHPRPWWEGGLDPSLHDVNPKTSQEHVRSGTSKKAEDAPSQPTERLLASVEALGARHLVIGHQPGKIKFSDGASREEGEMFAHYDGLFFMIDTGMSRGVASGRGALLCIQNDGPHITATAIYVAGKTTLLWRK